MRVQITEQLERQTGEGVEAWNAKIAQRSPTTTAELNAWLAEQGVTGYPQMLLRYETFGYPDYLLAGADELMDGQYADRPQLRPILDALLAVAPSLVEVEVQARKTYVTLLTPKRTFASIEPTSRTRVDLGMRLPDAKPEGRLQEAKSMGQSAVTVRIGLSSVDDVDDEAMDWLRRAYEANV
jgi:Domain of unknown function (DUF5655)